MLSFVYNGDAYISLQYNGNVLDTAQGLDAWVLNPRTEYPRFCYFNQAADAGLVDGVTLTGQTSAAVIKVGRVVLTGGTVTSAGAGVLFFREVSGKIVSGENLRVGATTYCVSASGQLDSPVGQPARALLIQAETNGIRFAIGGVAPTSSTGTPASFGVLVQAGENIQITGRKDVHDLQMIHAVAASNASVNVVVSY